MILIILISLYSLSLAFMCNNLLLVSTKVGVIKGVKDEMGYSKFLGIPYGQFLGNNYFAPAVPRANLKTVFKANNDSKICIQMNSRGFVIGTTDCLNLNIYVPGIACHKNRLPVMVWIHGNTFNSGSAIDEGRKPHSLLKHGVIVVTVNYRLGIFGFMCLGTPEFPGNNGLKDQVLALRWINKHIEAFGGDPNKITVFGKRSGAISINLHLFSLYEKLFNRAIIQSGPAYSYWAITEPDTSIPFKIAAKLGLKTTDLKTALNVLLEAKVYNVVKLAHNLLFTNKDVTDQPLGPCIENKFEGVENFITEHPMNLKAENANKTSVIIGYNTREFAMATAGVRKIYYENFNFSSYFAKGFAMSDDLNEAIGLIKKYYLGDQKIGLQVKEQLLEFGSDFIFNHPTYRMAKKLLESGAENVYSYVFSHNRNVDLTKTGLYNNLADELTYLFELNFEENSLQDHLVTDDMTELWTNFAKFGNPTPSRGGIAVKWSPISKNYLQYLEIDAGLALQVRPYFDRMIFWDMFYTLYEEKQKWYKHTGKQTVPECQESDPVRENTALTYEEPLKSKNLEGKYLKLNDKKTYEWLVIDLDKLSI